MSATGIEVNPLHHSTFFGYIGIASAIGFAALGSSYGTAKTGIGLCTMGVKRPDLIFKGIIPVVMAGILGIYGLIVGVIFSTKIGDDFNYMMGYRLFSAGLCCGLSCLAAGITIGIVGDAGVRANAQQEKVFIGMILILIFAEAVALYGFIISLLVASK